MYLKYIVSIECRILAVSYDARARGIDRRKMRGDEAKKLCPEVGIAMVPEVRGKADLTK